MLVNATIIMLIGMTTVFTFLIIMIGSMNCMSYVLGFFPEETPAAVSTGSSNELEEIAAVIAIAKEKI